MSDVKILSVERTGVPDELVVTGEVGDREVRVFVWESALYGDVPDPNAMDKSGRYHRAPDKLGGAPAAEGADPDPIHAEQNAGPREVQMPQTDAERQDFLRDRLRGAVAPAEKLDLAD